MPSLLFHIHVGRGVIEVALFKGILDTGRYPIYWTVE